MNKNVILTDKEAYPTLSRWLKNKLLKKLFKENDYLLDKIFLEIGCGTGEMLMFLDNKGMKGDGLDLSEECVNISINRTSENIYVYKKDFLSLDKQYDLILIMDVLEHFKDDLIVIKKIYSLLKPGGHLIINVPAHQKLFSNYDAYVGHYRRYEKEDLISMLKENEFYIKSFWSYGTNLIRTNKSFESKQKATLNSGINTVWYLKQFYPIIRWSYYLAYLQLLFLNQDLGANYLILCQKAESNQIDEKIKYDSINMELK